MTPDQAHDDSDALTIGRRIRQLRTAQGMTLEELAGRIDRAPSQVSMFETGKREPKLTLLQTIAKVLGTSLDGLLEGEPLDVRSASRGSGSGSPCRMTRSMRCSRCTARSSGCAMSAPRRPRRRAAPTSSCVI